MATTSLEERVGALEQEVARLKRRVEEADLPGKAWWDRVLGAFADNSVFDEAMQLGREYRESVQPPDKDVLNGQDVPA